MVRTYGETFPERALMSTISDLLGIGHFTTSRGSTVRRDFLAAVATAINIPDVDKKKKDELLSEIWEKTNGKPMPGDRFSNGATVTNSTLEEILNGIIAKNLGSLSHAGPLDSDDQGVVGPDVDFTTLRDVRLRKNQLTAIREGKDKFRLSVLLAYNTSCAVTSTDTPVTLDAAHIIPYSGPASNSTANGLCLRKDIHRLFDSFLLAIHEDTHEVLLSPSLKASTYAELEGRILAPTSKKDSPSPLALRAHRKQCEL